jgi:hypothetical protein
LAVHRGLSWENRRPVGLKGFKNREMLWLWCRLQRNGYILDSNRISNVDSRANHLIDKINEADKETVGNLQDYVNEFFTSSLRESEFKWIDFNNRRLVLFIISCISSGNFSIRMPYTLFDPKVLIPRERIKLAFDLSLISINEKKNAISSLHDHWSSAIEIDPSLNWVNTKDDDQCRWLFSELQAGSFASWVSPELNYPVNNEDRIIAFFNALDRSGSDLHLKKLYLKDLKSKWSRKQRKLNGRKVQCNLNLDLLTKKNIKKLSDHRNLKMGELVDSLVAEEVARLMTDGFLL